MNTDIDQLDQIVNHKPKLEKGEQLYRAGEKFTSVYAIRSGLVKVVSIQGSGDEIIHGFYLPGDVVGFDGIAQAQYAMTAIAVSHTSLCEIPYSELSHLAEKVPKLNTHLYEIMSRKINDSYYQAQLLAIKSAEERLAGFLWHMMERFRVRGYIYTEFDLPILHREVANYLGLTPETVSRLLTKMHKSGVLTWKKKHISIHDIPALEILAGFNKEGSCSQACAKGL